MSRLTPIAAVVAVVVLAGCATVPFKRTDQVATSRQTLDEAKVTEILTEAFRRNEKQQGACAYGMDAIKPIAGNQTAIVAFPVLKLNRLRSAPSPSSRMGALPPMTPSPLTHSTLGPPMTGSPTTASSSSTAQQPVTTSLDLDLREVKRVYVGRTDVRCELRDRLYQVTVSFPGDFLSIEVLPDRLIDVLAALTWQKPVEIVYADDPVD
jgi:outer membrane murein-binding lipoprotein Lpp